MKIYIQTMMGKLYTFDLLEKGMTGKEMKKELEKVDGGYWEDITLVFGGSMIDNEKNILEYGLQEESKIQSLMRYTRCTCEPCKKGTKMHWE